MLPKGDSGFAFLVVDEDQTLEPQSSRRYTKDNTKGGLPDCHHDLKCLKLLAILSGSVMIGDTLRDEPY